MDSPKLLGNNTETSAQVRANRYGQRQCKILRHGRSHRFDRRQHGGHSSSHRQGDARIDLGPISYLER